MPENVPDLLALTLGCGPSLHASFAWFDHDTSSWRTSRASDQQDISNAYAAGLLDGEGCISIYRSTHCRAHFYNLRIDVGMSDKGMPVLEWLQGTFGGRICHARQGTEKWRQADAWRLFGGQAAQFLEKVKPFIMLKSSQLSLALDFWRMVSSVAPSPERRKWTPDMRERAAVFKAQMHELNRKGPEQSLPVDAFAHCVDGIWLTNQRSPAGRSVPFSETWPRAGSMRNGIASQQEPLALHTSEKGCSLWPTVLASDAKGSLGQKRGDGGRKWHLYNAVGGPVTPEFAEWLMGFPPGWTDCGASAMRSSRKLRKRSE